MKRWYLLDGMTDRHITRLSQYPKYLSQWRRREGLTSVAYRDKRSFVPKTLRDPTGVCPIWYPIGYGPYWSVVHVDSLFI